MCSTSVTHHAVFTLELRRQGLLVLLVLESQGLGPLELPVHLVGDHASVHEPAHHGDQQQTLEDPALPAGAHPVSHGGPAALPNARPPQSRLWKVTKHNFNNKNNKK